MQKGGGYFRRKGRLRPRPELNLEFRDERKGVVIMNRLNSETLLIIFSYLPTYQDLFRCSLVCKKWRALLDSSSDVWKYALAHEVPKEFSSDKLIEELESPKAKLVAYLCSWSEIDHSKNIKLKENKLTLHREPIAQSTDAIRGKRGFYHGQHYWTVIWHGPNFGSNAVVGIATEEATLHGSGYYSLLGSDSQSWGWDISKNVLQHGGDVMETYPKASGIKVNISIPL